MQRRRHRIRVVVGTLEFLATIGRLATVVGEAVFKIGGDGGLDPTEHGLATFAPNSPDADGWYVVAGPLDTGGVDAFRAGTVDWDRLPDTARA